MSKKKKKKQLNNDDSEWFIIDDTEFDSEEYKQALANPKPRLIRSLGMKSYMSNGQIAKK